MTISLVRVDTTWHAFTNSRDAYDFYREWENLRDCECLIEVNVWEKGEYPDAS